MRKKFISGIESVVAKGHRILRRQTSKVGPEKVKGRRLSQLKKIGEKIRLKRKPRAETKGKKARALKVWEHSFEGSFNVAMKNTADFIKQRQKRRRDRKVRRQKEK